MDPFTEEDHEEIVVPHVPEPDEPEGEEDPNEDEDDGYVEGVDAQ